MGANHRYYLSINSIAEMKHLRALEITRNYRIKNDQIRDELKSYTSYRRIYQINTTWVVQPSTKNTQHSTG